MREHWSRRWRLKWMSIEEMIMYLSLYLRRGMIYIPTMGLNTAGYYSSVDPVAVAPVSDTIALRRAFQEAIMRGNPRVPTPDHSKGHKPVILKYANVNTWSAFERGASTWSIDDKDGVYRIIPCRRRPDRGWEDDLQNAVILPPGSTIDELCARATSIIQEHARK